ncbi:hypothetical protein H5410_031280 [Solanum commersonii]|uniref:Uncharacterized protein n=1 Tax=Solanum commersonii TaxID=4109 RepID=A0A9J5YLU2_SOLCO|nr:hypothetical protein H5410_031280 [Solanum commersonii]
MFLGMMQIVTAHNWYININAKGFSATYKDQDISYTFVTDPISRDINALINMKQKHADSLQLELFSMNIFNTLRSTKIDYNIKSSSSQLRHERTNLLENYRWNGDGPFPINGRI